MAADSKTILDGIFRLDRGSDLTQKQRTDLYRAMSPPSLVKAFFNEDFTNFREKYAGINIESLKETFKLLEGNIKLQEQVAEVILVHLRDMRPKLCKDEIESDLLRFVPIVLECPTFDKPDEEWGNRIIEELAVTLIYMDDRAKTNFSVLVRWWENDSDMLARVVKVYQEAYMNLLNNFTMDILDLRQKKNIHFAALRILYQVNKSLGYKIPVNLFYILQKDTDRRIEESFLQRNSLLHMGQFSFLLDIQRKWNMMRMHFDSTCGRHHKQILLKIRREFETSFEPGSTLWLEIFILPSLHLKPAHLQFEIDIEKIVESAISKIQNKRETALLLPFEVHFKDNVSLGVNAGGPMKELFWRFFNEELFNTQKHMVFKKLTDSPSSTTLWFNKDYKDVDKLRSVGKMFALMFYNKVIVTLPFPFLFYKKLLGNSRSSFEDLELLDPDIAKSLGTLREMNDDDLSDFSFTADGPENEPVIELRPGGKDEVVTAANVGEYIELYARYYTSSSQFDAFSECFRSMLSQFAIDQVFTPQELMALFQGGKYDWKAFQHSFRYEKGLTSDHRVVKMFWSVFQGDLTNVQKQDFLRVITGANHVPLGGFQEIGARIWPMGDREGQHPKDLCPEVNTCHGFVVLHLPMYDQREHLKERLLKLLEMKGHGFYKPAR
ncbi:probable E3 ubiquitin-protein ligase HERC4 [Lytechinus variegatus]|uniref:probable E3 ubiquitin-protein ligase HERC4 n=1 Tax=Lytechinus variegatus TaxID=7654 RepID=UPI001BB18E36|nr:probable E3 ubiquitin-protein ligase HERC4 [Lytechinus variegatus]